MTKKISQINLEEEIKMDEFDFGEALHKLKEGKTVSRKGWNGKEQYIYYVGSDKYIAKTEIAKKIVDKDNKVSYQAYIAIKTINDEIVPWVASQSDLLAED